MIDPGQPGVRSDLPLAAVSTPGLWAVVLAAGGARRFGRSKLALRIGPRSLLQQVVDRAFGVTGGRCVVVLGARGSRLRAELRGRPLTVVVNRHWRDGMAGSLRVGLDAVPASARAVLVLLADQYAVGAGDLRRLAAAWSRRPWQAAATCVNGRLGAPAILPRPLFPRLRRLSGDEGARQLLRAPDLAVTAVELPTAGLDLDTPRDLSRMRHNRRRGSGMSAREQ